MAMPVGMDWSDWIENHTRGRWRQLANGMLDSLVGITGTIALLGFEDCVTKVGGLEFTAIFLL